METLRGASIAIFVCLLCGGCSGDQPAVSEREELIQESVVIEREIDQVLERAKRAYAEGGPEETEQALAEIEAMRVRIDEWERRARPHGLDPSASMQRFEAFRELWDKNHRDDPDYHGEQPPRHLETPVPPDPREEP